MDPQLFAPGAPGDPATILSRAFSDPTRGMSLTINLAFGGVPFTIPLGSENMFADWELEQSVLQIHSVQIWRL